MKVNGFNSVQYAKQLGMKHIMSVPTKDGFSAKLLWAENKADYVFVKNGGICGGGRVCGNNDKVGNYISGVLEKLEGIAEPGINVWKEFTQAAMRNVK